MSADLPVKVSYQSFIDAVTPKLAGTAFSLNGHNEVIIDNMYARYSLIVSKNYSHTASFGSGIFAATRTDPEYRKFILTRFPTRTNSWRQEVEVADEYTTPNHLIRFAQELNKRSSKLLRKHNVPVNAARTAVTSNIWLTSVAGLGGAKQFNRLPNRTYEFIKKDYTPNQILLLLQTTYAGEEADGAKEMPVEWFCKMFGLKNPLLEEDPNHWRR